MTWLDGAGANRQFNSKARFVAPLAMKHLRGAA